ncbi:MAG: hypothetical protein M3P26_04490 [Gemmatimonadota bacterium]|nr:hypothetical protein [Gemmatimonadota bacterium]
MEDNLKRALVLRLNSHRAIMLNQLVSIGCEVMNGNHKTALFVAGHAREFNDRHPEERRPLLDSISLLVESVPQEILDAEGMSHYSANELRYKVEDGS